MPAVTRRSATSTMASDSNLGQITGELSKLLDQKLAPLVTSIESLTSKLNDCVTQDELSKVYTELNELKGENQLLKEKLLQIEMQDRRNNLRFLNIPEKATSESWADCENSVCEIISSLGIDSSLIRIERAHRIGPSTTAVKPRHIIVKFLSFKDRELVLQTFYKNKKALKSDVIVREDWPMEIEERRNKLWPYFKEAKQADKVKAKLAVDKLVINSTVYTSDKTSDIPKEFHPSGCKETPHAIAFFSGASPFSNFHQSDFSDDGRVFSSVEQYVVFQKATLFNDDDATEAVMKLSDPVKIKVRGKRIKNYDHKIWLEARVGIMKKALHCKFSQCNSLKQKLSETGRKTLIEANKYDKFWGGGISLRDLQPNTVDQLPGRNTLGKLLMELRTELCR